MNLKSEAIIKVDLIDRFKPDNRFEKNGSHRLYIGGMWEKIGRLQLDFLLSKGLKPSNYLLDIACGSLRLGVKVIPYLEAGHYLGIEKEAGLVSAGLRKELPETVWKEKQPNIVISSSFEFEKLNQKASFAIAQSLFSHLPVDLIDSCFKKLNPVMTDDGVFYATFNLAKRQQRQTWKEYGDFAYTRDEVCHFGSAHGFSSNYIGNWNHPRHQVIVEYKKQTK